MGYNKKKHLQDNILAIETAFQLEQSGAIATAEQLDTLKQYTGFGGLKCILRPCQQAGDLEKWPLSEQELFTDTAHLYKIIKNHSAAEEEYKSYVASLHTSILSAFYTPTAVTEAIAGTLHAMGLAMHKVLDPSAGAGVFLDSFQHYAKEPMIAFEKDQLTAKILKSLHPKSTIFNQGFETIDSNLLNHFDIISSNIPFGDFRVFDPVFSESKDKTRHQATKSIHNYFFLKAIDAAREGGVIAFITSQGVMNSPNNTAVREWLMNHCILVSAIRLPNNLFTENANTEVGSDLIVLQKNSHKNSLSDREQAFIQTRSIADGLSINNYHMDFSRIIHTRAKLGTDPYGKPAMEFWYEKSIEELGQDLKKLLLNDCQSYLNIRLYQQHLKTSTANQVAKIPTKPNKQPASTTLSLYDLFGIPEEERTQIKQKQKTKAGQKPLENTDSSIADITDPLNLQEYSKEKRPYEGVLMDFFKEGTLVESKGQFGILSIENVWSSTEQGNIKRYDFTPLQIPKQNTQKIQTYFSLREAYFFLHEKEVAEQCEQTELRMILNRTYQNFVKNDGDLNSKENSKLIQLDSLGVEMLTLEYYENGQKQLADIFNRPVAFQSDKSLFVERADEALAASINKYGYVDLSYMSSISNKNKP